MAKRLRSSNVFIDNGFPLRIMRVRAGTHAQGPPPVLHSHEFHELVVVMEGSGAHYTSEGDYPLGPGDVFLIRGEAAHGYGRTERFVYINILFEPKQLQLPMGDLAGLPGYHVLFRVEPKLRDVHKLRGALRLTTEQLAEAAQHIARAERELDERRPGYRFMALTSLMHLIGYLSRCESDTGKPERRQLLKLGEAISYIENNYVRTITVDTLCEVADMSESSLVRAFKSVMGRPPMDHVIRVRITRAAEMLRKTDLKITDVAFRCGFSDSNYFSRQFRQVMSMSPRDYRKRGA